MATHHEEPVVCQCGHQGTVHWSENDAPYSKQWESYSIAGFDGEGFTIDGYMTTDQALERLMPRCPKCGTVGKVHRA